MPRDRALAIEMTFNGYYDPTGGDGPGYYGHVSYQQLPEGTDPPMPPEVVAADGTINVSNAPAYDSTVYNATFDITLSLSPNSKCIHQDGKTVMGVTWAPRIVQDPDPNVYTAMRLTDETNTTLLPPEQASAAFVDGSNQTKILIDDKDETKNYYFRPGIVIPDAGGYFISCDPPLINRKL